MSKKVTQKKLNNGTVTQSAKLKLGGWRFAFIIILAVVVLASFASATFAWYKDHLVGSEFVTGSFFIEESSFSIEKTGTYTYIDDGIVSKFDFAPKAVTENNTVLTIKDGEDYNGTSAIAVSKPTFEKNSIYLITFKISGTSNLSGYVYISYNGVEYYSHQLIASSNAYTIEFRSEFSGVHEIRAVWGEHNGEVSMHNLDNTWTQDNNTGTHYRYCTHSGCSHVADLEKHYSFRWNIADATNPYGTHTHNCVCGKEHSCVELDITAKSKVLFDEMPETSITSGKYLLFENVENPVYNLAVLVGSNGLSSDVELYDGTYKVSVATQTSGTITAWDGSYKSFAYDTSDKLYDNETTVDVEYGIIKETLNNEYAEWAVQTGDRTVMVYIAEQFFHISSQHTENGLWTTNKPTANGVGYDLYSSILPQTNGTDNGWKDFLYLGNANPTTFDDIYSKTSGLFDFKSNEYNPKVISFKLQGDSVTGKDGSQYFIEFKLFTVDEDSVKRCYNVQICQWNGTITLKKGGDPDDGIGLMPITTFSIKDKPIDCRLVIGNNLYIFYVYDEQLKDFRQVNEPFMLDGNVVDVAMTALHNNLDNRNWLISELQINPAPAYELQFDELVIIKKNGEKQNVSPKQYTNYLDSLTFGGQTLEFAGSNIFAEPVPIIAGQSISIIAKPKKAVEPTMYSVEGVYIGDRKIANITYDNGAEQDRASTLTALFSEVAYNDDGQRCSIKIVIEEKTFPGPNLKLTISQKFLSVQGPKTPANGSTVKIFSNGFEKTATVGANGVVTFTDVPSGEYIISCDGYGWRFNISSDGEYTSKYCDRTLTYVNYESLPTAAVGSNYGNITYDSGSNTYSASIMLTKEYEIDYATVRHSGDKYNPEVDQSTFAYGNVIFKDVLYTAYQGDGGLGDGTYDSNNNLISDASIYDATGATLKMQKGNNYKYAMATIYDPMIKFGTKAKYGDYCYYETGRDIDWWINAASHLPNGQTRIDLGVTTLTFQSYNIKDHYPNISDLLSFGTQCYIYPKSETNPNGKIDWSIRFGHVQWRGVPMTDAQLELYRTTGLKIAVVFTGDTVYGFVDDGTGNMICLMYFRTYFFGTFIEYEFAGVQTYFHDDYISDIDIRETIPNVELKKTVVGKGDINISETKVGGDVTITAIPESGYRLKKLIVDGVDMTHKLNGNQYLIKECKELELRVQAEFESIITTYTITHTVLGGANTNSLYPQNKKTLSLVDESGTVITYATVNKGAVDLEIPSNLSGTYYYYMEGYTKIQEKFTSGKQIDETTLNFIEAIAESSKLTLSTTSNGLLNITAPKDVIGTVEFSKDFDFSNRSMLEFDIEFQVSSNLYYVAEFIFNTPYTNAGQEKVYYSFIMQNNGLDFRFYQHSTPDDTTLYSNNTGGTVTLTGHVSLRIVKNTTQFSITNFKAGSTALDDVNKLFLTESEFVSLQYNVKHSPDDIPAPDIKVSNFAINTSLANLRFEGLFKETDTHGDYQLFTQKDISFELREMTEVYDDTKTERTAVQYIYINNTFRYVLSSGKTQQRVGSDWVDATPKAYIYNETNREFEEVDALGTISKRYNESTGLTTYTISGYAFDSSNEVINVKTFGFTTTDITTYVSFDELPNDTVYAEMTLEVTKVKDVAETFGGGFCLSNPVTNDNKQIIYGVRYNNYENNKAESTAGDTFSFKQEWQLRVNNYWRTYYVGKDTNATSIKISIGVAVANGKTYLLAGENIREMSIIDVLNVDGGEIYCITNYNACESIFTSFNSYTHIPSSIKKSITCNETRGSVSVSGNFLDRVTITAEPKVGYKVGKVTLNGKDITFGGYIQSHPTTYSYEVLVDKTSAKNTYVIEGYYNNYADVVVEFVQIVSTYSVTYNCYHKDSSYQTNDYLMKAGQVIRFYGKTTGYVVGATTDANGKISLQLPADTYDIYVDGHSTGTTVTIAGDVTNGTLSINRPTYEQNNYVGRYVPGYEGMSDITIDDPFGISYSQASHKYVRDSQLVIGQGFSYNDSYMSFDFKITSNVLYDHVLLTVYDKNIANFKKIQFLLLENKILVKVHTPNTNLTLTKESTVYGSNYGGTNEFISTIVHFSGSKITVYLPNQDIDSRIVYDLGFTPSFMTLGGSDWSAVSNAWEIKNLRLYDAQNVAVKYTYDSAHCQFEQAPTTIQNATTRNFKITTKYASNNSDFYTVKSVKINGEVVWSSATSVHSAEFTYTPYTYDTLNIVVETALTKVYRYVKLTLKSSDAVLKDAHVLKGKTVTIKNSSNTVVQTLKVGDNGLVLGDETGNYMRLAYGDFTVEVPGYTSQTFTVDGTTGVVAGNDHKLYLDESVTMPLTLKVFENNTLDSTGSLSASDFKTAGEQTLASDFANNVIYMEFFYRHNGLTYTGDEGGTWFRLHSKTTNHDHETSTTFGGHHDSTTENGSYTGNTGNWGFRFGGNSNWVGKSMTQDQYNTFKGSQGLKMGVAIIDGIAYGLLSDGLGTYRVYLMTSREEYDYIVGIGFNNPGPSDIKDIKVYTDLNSCPQVVQSIAGKNFSMAQYMNQYWKATGNATTGYTVTMPDPTQNAGMGYIVPYSFANGKGIEFNLTSKVDSTTKVYPFIYLYTGKSANDQDPRDRIGIQFCCWNGNWSIKICKRGVDDFGNTSGQGGELLKGESTKIRIKADTNGDICIFINDGVNDIPLTMPENVQANLITGFRFTNSAGNLTLSNGEKAWFKFTNFKPIGVS
ncbi:MAG: hypothetical protein J6V68_03170 [Clostridia bacterium]|nr:hypothetical protein [Clostridia bacterium]